MLATKRDLVAKKNYQYYLITNTRGDIIETRNGDGNVNAKFVYDAWGKLIAVTNASGTPLSQNSFAYQISLKYRGYVYDNETGLYYLQSRYYDPETGRFLNADDVEYIGASGTVLGHNAFAYCENNAVCCLDTVGFVYKHIFAKIFYSVAVCKIVISFLTNYLNVKEVLSVKSIKYDDRTGMYSCKAKYLHIDENHWMNIQLGDKDAWNKSCDSSNLTNTIAVNTFNSLIEFSSGNMSEFGYNPQVMYLELLLSYFGMILTYYTADYKAAMSKKVYNRIWGPYGLDPNDTNNYVGIKISGAESDTGRDTVNGYYAFCYDNNYGEVISR